MDDKSLIARRIDSKVRATLHKVYKDKITESIHDMIEFKTERDMKRYEEDYLELTKIYMAEYKVTGITD